MKFIHLRLWNTDFPSIVTSNHEKGNGTLYGCGGVTVAFDKKRDIDVIRWTAARCNINDHYVKQYGRTKAIGRMKSKKHIHVFLGSPSEFQQYIRTKWVKSKSGF
jgi:hypothetical protein